MKKLKTGYAFLFILLSSSSAIHAMTSTSIYLNDSTISYDLVNKVRTAKHIYTYNQYGKKTIDQTFTWDNVNSIWVPSLTTTLTYNSLNQNTLTLKSKYTVLTNSWAPSTKSTSAFDMNGKDVMDEDSVINTSTGLYKANYHTVNTYDAQGNKTSIRNKWNTTTVTWTIPYDQTTTTSDSILLTDSLGVSRKLYKTLYNTTSTYDIPSSSFLNTSKTDLVYQLIASKKPYIAEGSKIEQIASTYTAGVAGAAGTWSPASKQDFVGDSISGLSYVNKYTYSGGTYSYTSQDTRYFTPRTIVILPTISLQTSNLNTNSFTLNWTAPTSGTVAGYDVYQNGVYIGSTTSTTSLAITGLSNGTIYSMSVNAKDASGKVIAISTPLAVSTVDTQAPSTPSNLTYSSLTANSFTLGWTASTDNLGVTAYDIYKDGVFYGSTSSSTSLIISGLTLSSTYNMTVKARDAANNSSSASAPLAVTTVDNVAPSSPGNLQVSLITGTSFTLSWTAASDNVGVIGYDIFKNGVLVGSSTDTIIKVTALSSATQYTMLVKSKDAAGNYSITNTPLTVTTLDITAPSTPTNLQASAPGAMGVSISWTASTDNVGVIKYYVYKDGILSDSTSTSNYLINSLQAGSSAQFTIKAVDMAGNLSIASSPVLVAIKYQAIQIGMVGVVANNKNMVVWNKPITSGIASFYIYRETNVMDVYEKIGALPYDSLSVFIDSNSNPDLQSNKYKISIFDKQGLESDKSIAHKTMHLSMYKVSGTAWQLIWQAYEGFLVTTYNIYRGTTPNNLKLVGSTSGSNTQYTDITAPTGSVYYQLEVINPNVVIPTKVASSLQQVNCSENLLLQSYSSSFSNITSYIETSNGINNNSTVNFEIYPNPTQGEITISLGDVNSTAHSITVSNSLGQKLYNEKMLSDKTTLDLSQFGSKGIYFVQILDEKGNNMGRKKLIVQ
jgi:chitodextrinase